MQRKHTSLGEAIKVNRERCRMTRAQLADAIGIKYSTLSNYENDVREPELKTLCQLATYFGLTIDEFLSCDATKEEILTLIKTQTIAETEAVALLQAWEKIEYRYSRKRLMNIIEKCAKLDSEQLSYVEKFVKMFE